MEWEIQPLTWQGHQQVVYWDKQIPVLPAVVPERSHVWVVYLPLAFLQET